MGSFGKSLSILSEAIGSKYIYPVCLFYAIFRWPNFCDPFDFRLQKRDKNLAPSLHKVLLEPFSPMIVMYAINRNCFGDLYLWCEGWFLEIDRTPPPTHRPISIPQSTFASPLRCTTLRPFN